MKTLLRALTVCSIVTTGLVAPAVAGADATEEKGHGGDSDPATARAGDWRGALERALKAAELEANQQKKAYEVLDETSRAYDPVSKAKRALMMSVADQVEAGKIEKCDLDQQIDTLASAKASAMPKGREAFERWHSIFDKGQRERFADSLEEQFASWRQEHSPEAMVDKLTRELGLNDEQKDKVGRILEGAEQVRDAVPELQWLEKKRWSKIFDAFEKDDFDFDQVDPLEDTAEKTRSIMEARLATMAAVLHVLDDEQEGRLAKLIREKAQHHDDAEDVEVAR